MNRETQPAQNLALSRQLRRDVSLKDGTIEFDMAVTPHRSFVYLLFRMEDDRHFEEIYFRWIDIRLVVSGERAALFAGDDDGSKMVIPLERTPRAGYFAVS